MSEGGRALAVAAQIVALLVGIAVVAAPAWLRGRTLRAWAGLWVALGTLAALRVVWLFASGGDGANATLFAVPLALAAAALAAWRLPAAALRRVAFLVPSLVLVVYVTTVLMFSAPGNPFAEERVVSPRVEQALRAQYGVPDDANAFFAIYMRRLLVDGTFGPSIKVQGRDVEDLLLPALPVSLSLGMLALLIAVVFGVGLGVRAGLSPGQAADRGSMALALVGISLPNFVIGALLVVVFAFSLGWLPVAGWGGYRHVLLPAVTLALPHAATIARLARSGTIDVMSRDFIRTARAKGLPEVEVVFTHALRGALLPVVSYLGPASAGIMTGSFVVEVLFGVPGMGQWFVRGAVNRDYSIVLGTAILYFGMITIFNLLVDFAYAWLDPRARQAEARA